MATASCPTRTDETGANTAATRSAASGSTRTTATSWPPDPPTTSPARRVPSDRVTATSSVPSTTCWLVTMYPLSASHTMPEPKPNPIGESNSTSTTDGPTASATATTGSSATAGAGYCGAAASGIDSAEATAGPSGVAAPLRWPRLPARGRSRRARPASSGGPARNSAGHRTEPVRGRYRQPEPGRPIPVPPRPSKRGVGPQRRPRAA